MNIYWSKLLVNVAMMASVTCVIIFGIRAGMHGEQIVAIVVPLFAAAMQMLPAIDKAKTTFPTIRPPPPARVDTIPCPPPAMAPWSEVFHTGDTGRPPPPKDMIIPPPNDVPKVNK